MLELRWHAGLLASCSVRRSGVFASCVAGIVTVHILESTLLVLSYSLVELCWHSGLALCECAIGIPIVRIPTNVSILGPY